MNIMVDMTNFFSWTVILHFVRLFIVFNVAHVLLKDKYNSFVTFISVIGVGLTVSAICLLFDSKYEMLYMFLVYLSVTIALHLVTEGSLPSKILCAVIGIANNALATLIFSAFAKVVWGEEAAVIFEYEVPLMYLLSMSLFSLAFSYIFVVIIALFSKKFKSIPKFNAKYIVMLIFPITHVFTAIPVAKSMLSASSSDLYDFINIFFTFQCIFMDVVLVFIIDYLDKIENEKAQKDRELLISTMALEQVEMFKTEKQEFRRIKHDYLNIIATAKGFIEIGKPEKALSILSGTDDNIMGLAGFSVCANETLNTVLYIKLKSAEKKNVTLTSEIDEQNAIHIDDYDLCRILHNLLDNCINAAANSSEKKCKIKVEITDSSIAITTENSYNALEKSVRKKKSDEHGNGIGIIKNIVKKYHGEFGISQSDDTWTTTAVLENKRIEK